MNYQLSFKAGFWNGLFFLIFVYLYPDSAQAANPSGKAANYVSGVYDFLTADWTVSVVAIGLIAAGLMTMRGVIPIMYLVSVTAGTFLIYAGSIIAQWLFGLSH